MKDHKIKLFNLKNKVQACNNCKYYVYLYSLVLILSKFMDAKTNLSKTMIDLDALRVKIGESIDAKEFKTPEAMNKFKRIHFDIITITCYYSHDVGLMDIDMYKAVANNLILSI